MDYAIIKLGGKQYRVSEGMTLVVDRLTTEEGGTFTPDVLLGDAGATVTAKVLTHERGPKIRIGKYKKRTGYRRHNGFRAAVSRIQIESIGAGKAAKAPARKAEAPKEAAAPKDAATAKEAAAPKEAKPKVVEAAEAVEAPAAGLPEGYSGLTVAQIGAAAGGWSADELAAALAYEQEHAKRKGALAALESAIGKEGDA